MQGVVIQCATTRVYESLLPRARAPSFLHVCEPADLKAYLKACVWDDQGGEW